MQKTRPRLPLVKHDLASERNLAQNSPFLLTTKNYYPYCLRFVTGATSLSPLSKQYIEKESHYIFKFTSNNLNESPNVVQIATLQLLVVKEKV